MAPPANKKQRTEASTGREANDDGAAFRKLRSCEPDLKVIIKYTNEAGEAQEKEYELYSQTLAKLSKFVDTCLSVEMKEKNEAKISFEGISPDLFELALRCFENPVEARTVTTKTALQLVEFYDKYEFSEGIALCDQIIHDYFVKLYNGDSPPVDLDLCIDAAVMSDMLDLKSKSDAVRYLGNIWEQYEQNMFSLDHIKKLHPLFKKGLFENDVIERDFSEEELQSPLFPKFFLQPLWYRYEEMAVEHLWLTGTKTKADGEYKHDCSDQGYIVGGESEDRDVFFDGRSHWVSIAGLDSEQGDPMDWEIQGWGDVISVPVVLWRCPGSKNARIPPEGPWIPVHEFAKGKKPKISYSPPGK